jgi:hypothetical protein
VTPGPVEPARAEPPAPAANGTDPVDSGLPREDDLERLRQPDPEFTVIEAVAVERAAAPTLRFKLGVSEASGREIYTIALTVLVTVEPAKRAHDAETRERLVELFGAPERWANTTQSFRWTQLDVLVPNFAGKTTFDVSMPCTYDLEVAATKYFHGLDDGLAPLRLHLSGTIFYRAEGGRLQMAQVPWDCSIRFSMPVAVWKQTIAEHYPYRGWVPLHTETIERLRQHRAERGLPSFDEAVIDLIRESGE